jgi:hypothetical protein
MPKPGSLKPYVARYHRSLVQYSKYYEPLLTASFGERIPEHLCYLCPLCLEKIVIFSEQGLYTNASFNLDHYPPKSIGGKKAMLVCEQCNNLAGTKFEPDLIDFLKLHSYYKKVEHSTMNAKAVLRYKKGKTLPGKYDIKLKIGNDGNQVFDFGDAIRKYPLAVSWLDYVKDNWSDWEVTLSGVLPSEKKVAKSMVKAAYLYCFSLWGYEFAFSSGADKLRQVINDKTEYPFKQGYAYLLQDNVENIPTGVCFIAMPKEARSLVVHIPMILKETGYKCVAGVPIPNPSESGWEDLFKYPKEGLHVSVRVFHPFDINKNVKGYSSTWARIISGEI